MIRDDDIDRDVDMLHYILSFHAITIIINNMILCWMILGRISSDDYKRRICIHKFC